MRKAIAIASIFLGTHLIFTAHKPVNAYSGSVYTCRIVTSSSSVNIRERPNGRIVQKVVNGRQFKTHQGYVDELDIDPVNYDESGKMWVRFYEEDARAPFGLLSIGYVSSDLVQCRSNVRG